MEDINTKFETWAMVELFGHNQLAGKVSEQVIAGQSFIRIDVPATSKCPAFTKYHLPTAVYGLTPVDQDYATRMAERIAAKPINDYKHTEVISEIVKEQLSIMESRRIETPIIGDSVSDQPEDNDDDDDEDEDDPFEDNGEWIHDSDMGARG